MDPHATPRATVSNLVMTFDDAAGPLPDPRPRAVAPPRPRSFSYDLTALDEATDWANADLDDVLGAGSTLRDATEFHPTEADGGLQERRSAFEIAFILLAGALAIMVATPPLVQLIDALRG